MLTLLQQVEVCSEEVTLRRHRHLGTTPRRRPVDCLAVDQLLRLVDLELEPLRHYLEQDPPRPRLLAQTLLNHKMQFSHTAQALSHLLLLPVLPIPNSNRPGNRTPHQLLESRRLLPHISSTSFQSWNHIEVPRLRS